MFPPMRLLEKSLAKKRARAEQARIVALRAAQEALRELMPGEKAVLFGSVAKPGKFRENSDVDVALFATPARVSEFSLQVFLEESLGRSVDVVMLPDCRFREKILREGIVCG